MELQYLSWLRNRTGKAKETVKPPEGIETLSQLVEWLSNQDEAYQALFSYRSIINASVNGQLVADWHIFTVKKDDRICFFSPLAGG